MTLALAGKRVVLLRAKDQPGDFAAELTSLGAEVILFPTIDIQALDLADDWGGLRQRFDGYQFILFSSAYAVRYFKAELDRCNLSVAGKKLVVVGKATERVALEHGFTVDYCSQIFTMAATVENLLSESWLDGCKGLFPCSRLASDNVCKQLQKNNISLDRLDIYDTLCTDTKRRILLSELSIDGAIFCVISSPSTIKNLYKMFDKSDLHKIVEKIDFVSIGPVSSQAAAQLGLKILAQADPHSSAGLITALLSL